MNTADWNRPPYNKAPGLTLRSFDPDALAALEALRVKLTAALEAYRAEHADEESEDLDCVQEALETLGDYKGLALDAVDMIVEETETVFYVGEELHSRLGREWHPYEYNPALAQSEVGTLYRAFLAALEPVFPFYFGT